MICNRLIDASLPLMQDLKVEKLVVGLSYIGLKNSSGNTGLAYILRNRLSCVCSQLEDAGNFNGMNLADMAKLFMDHHNPLKAAIGLAAINSVTPHESNEYDETDIIDLLDIREGENVGMVGRFDPLIKKIKNITPNLFIIDDQQNHCHGGHHEDNLEILGNCRVVLITSTTLLNKTFEPVMEKAHNADIKVLIGASTPLYREFYKDTGINYASGVVVENGDRILEIAGHGGGVRNFRKYNRKVTLILDAGKKS
jgi:uncharacterized protein (DUF4213/DUF364 family)